MIMIHDYDHHGDDDGDDGDDGAGSHCSKAGCTAPLTGLRGFCRCTSGVHISAPAEYTRFTRFTSLHQWSTPDWHHISAPAMFWCIVEYTRVIFSFTFDTHVHQISLLSPEQHTITLFSSARMTFDLNLFHQTYLSPHQKNTPESYLN